MTGKSAIPNILLLPDGNRRWAFNHEVTPQEGYEAGARRVVECAFYLGGLGVKECWVGLTRPSNHDRAPENVKAILEACVRVHEIAAEASSPINITVGGQLDLLPADQRERLMSQEANSSSDNPITAHLLFGWSGEYEASELARLARDKVDADPETLLLEASPIKSHIDLAIRTGMRQHTGRLSGMLPLHSLDAEIYLPEILFPDFSKAELGHAIAYWADRYPPNL